MYVPCGRDCISSTVTQDKKVVFSSAGGKSIFEQALYRVRPPSFTLLHQLWGLHAWPAGVGSQNRAGTVLRCPGIQLVFRTDLIQTLGQEQGYVQESEVVLTAVSLQKEKTASVLLFYTLPYQTQQCRVKNQRYPSVWFYLLWTDRSLWQWKQSLQGQWCSGHSSGWH